MKKMRPILITIGITVIVSSMISARITAGFTDPPVSSGSCTELVSDGGFEAGGQGWSQYSKLGFRLVNSFYPRRGRLGAQLGAENNADDRLTQSLALPTQADSITLSLWWALSTEENPGDAFDFLWVRLYSSDGATQIASLMEVHNDSAEQWVWNPASADLTAYAGQSLQLRIEATTDESNPTSFFVDDVSILSCGAAAITSSPTATASPTLTWTPTTGAPGSGTPSATPSPSPTLTPGTPVPSPTQSPTSTATQTPTSTSTPYGWTSPTPTKTRTPGLMDRRMYLPVVLRAQ